MGVRGTAFGNWPAHLELAEVWASAVLLTVWSIDSFAGFGGARLVICMLKSFRRWFDVPTGRERIGVILL